MPTAAAANSSEEEIAMISFHPHNESFLMCAPFIHPRVESMHPFYGERSCLFD
jgi:hypothetical protein